MKHCPYCKRAVQRWGTTAAGTKRYFCPSCDRTLTARKHTETRERNLRRELDMWLGGKDSLSEIAEQYHVSRQTLWRHFRPMFKIPFESPPPNESIDLLILDGTYIHRNKLCVLVAIDEKDRIYWHFAPYESYQAWYEFLSKFPKPEVVVMDGQKGLFLAAQRLWPLTSIQRCQFHVVSFVAQYTGRRPKDQGAKDMLDLMYRLKDAKTPLGRDLWTTAFKAWEIKYDLQLYARNQWGEYKYPRLRSIRYIVRKALPNLFTFLEHPETPNTTNLVEGWVNTALAEALRRHRGLKEYEKHALVSTVLSHLKRKSRAETKLEEARVAKAKRAARIRAGYFRRAHYLKKKASRNV